MNALNPKNEYRTYATYYSELMELFSGTLLDDHSMRIISQAAMHEAHGTEFGWINLYLSHHGA